MKEKNVYASPEVDVLEVGFEGVVCTSLQGGSVDPGTLEDWGTL